MHEKKEQDDDQPPPLEPRSIIVGEKTENHPHELNHANGSAISSYSELSSTCLDFADNSNQDGFDSPQDFTMDPVVELLYRKIKERYYRELCPGFSDEAMQRWMSPPSWWDRAFLNAYPVLWHEACIAGLRAMYKKIIRYPEYKALMEYFDQVSVSQSKALNDSE